MSDVQAIFLTRKCWNVQAFLEYMTPTLDIIGISSILRRHKFPEVLPKKVTSLRSVPYLPGSKLLLSKT